MHGLENGWWIPPHTLDTALTHMLQHLALGAACALRSLLSYAVLGKVPRVFNERRYAPKGSELWAHALSLCTACSHKV